MDKLNSETGFIAGVNNPLFISKKDNYDVLLQLDTNKIGVNVKHGDTYDKEPYYKIETDFIVTLIEKIKLNAINDEEIRQCFHSYT